MRPGRPTPWRCVEAGLAAALCLLIWSGCASEASSADEPDKPKLPFTCTLGLPGSERGFHALGPSSEGELMMGFQGFLVVEMRILADAEAPAEGRARVAITVDGEAPFQSIPDRLHFSEAPADMGAGFSQTDIFPLRLESGQIGAFRDRMATISIRVESDERFCVDQGPLRFVDHDKCLHTGETPVCPGDPKYPAGGRPPP